ncbi:MAG: hypothetical protein BGP09_21300 [Rhizobium sp. 60-20]|jgi:hypothetical protein|nr:MAG: hypothetical protein BGP09_21300 [Rhizobium sp. 60-20]RKD50350.1 hypothetical protein BJ928_12217 [Rhizobium sp. WW_1]
MTHTAKYAAPEPGKVRRAVSVVWAFLQAMPTTRAPLRLHIESGNLTMLVIKFIVLDLPHLAS